MKASICIATHNKAPQMRQVLESIYCQKPPLDFETIVIDDGPPDNQTETVCKQFPVQYCQIQRKAGFRNPCTARNVAYRKARGEVVIAQAEISHIGLDVIERLSTDISPGHFLLANVLCLDPNGEVCGTYVSPRRKRPLFFLGSMYREDLYAIGGNDEDFSIAPAYDDDWFAQCLLNGAHLKPVYSSDIIGHHLHHPICNDLSAEWKTERLYNQKCQQASEGEIEWCSSGGPWSFVSGQSLEDVQGKSVEEQFTQIYEKEEFYDPSAGISEVSPCGAGSTLESTQAVREKLPPLLKRLGVKTLVDVCCGDGNWLRETDLGIVSYIGVDITRVLIKENRRCYQGNKWQYRQMDVLKAVPPVADLILCRDALVHFSFEDTLTAIENICKSNSKYLLTTTFTKRKCNVGIQTGNWAPHNLQLPPFNFPPPLEVINEECREHDPHFRDKSLGLWQIKDIAPLVARVL